MTFTPARGDAAWRPCSRKAEARRLAMGRQAGGIDQQIGVGEIFFAGPEASLVKDDIDSRGAVFNVICEQDIAELCANFIFLEREWAVSFCGVFRQPFPVALKCERDAAGDTQGCEEPPSTEQSALARR